MMGFCYNRPVKNLFKGKKAIVTIPIALSIAVVTLPFAVGIGFGYLAYKKIPNVKLKFGSIAIIALLTLFMGSAYVAALISPSKPEAKQTQKQTEAKAEEENASSVLSETSTASTTSQEITPKGQEAQVIKVVDGDTVTVSFSGKNETIRIIGINTPETVDPRKSVECFGQKASDKAKEQLNGKTVQLEADATQGERDKYNRLLRFVWLDNGTVDFGAVMIQEGYAYEYTYSTPYTYQTKYKELQKEAEQNKRGLWADNACPVPTATPATTNNSATQQNKPTSPNAQQPTTNSTSSGDKDCPDFKTHAEAQTYFNSKGGSSSNNVDNLDADHDGIACESLP